MRMFTINDKGQKHFFEEKRVREIGHKTINSIIVATYHDFVDPINEELVTTLYFEKEKFVKKVQQYPFYEAAENGHKEWVYAVEMDEIRNSDDVSGIDIY